MSFFERLRPSPRVWGLPPSQVRITFESVTKRGLIRPSSNPSGSAYQIENLTVRPILGEDHRKVERVRWADRQWLEPWEATLPPGVNATLPSLSEYQRKTDAEVEQGVSLPMMIEADGRIIGVVTAANTVRGALYSTTVGYWIVSEFAGRGITSLAVASVIDLLIMRLGLHRVEINIRPQNAPSIGLARKLGLREEGYKQRYMSIGGNWADHVAFAIDSESMPPGGLVKSIWGAEL